MTILPPPSAVVLSTPARRLPPSARTRTRGEDDMGSLVEAVAGLLEDQGDPQHGFWPVRG
jgi:hypothetical protein